MENQPNVEKMMTKKDVKNLIKALKHKDTVWYVRRDIVRALGGIGGKDVVEHLAQAKDEVYDVQLEAARALDKMGFKPRNDTEKAHLLLAQEKYDKLAELEMPAVEPLTQVLRRFGKPEIANSLIRIGEPAVEPLIGALGAQAAWARYQAARALGEIGDARAIDALTQVLEKETNNEILEVAKNAIVKIKGK
jgi:HEAT repeat protein